MKKSIGKAATEFLRKAAVALRGKAGALRARLLFLVSLRRRAAVVAGISRQIRALSPVQRDHQEKAAGGRAVVILPRPPADNEDAVDDAAKPPAGNKRDGDVVAVGMAELASLFREVDEDGSDDGGYYYQDWTLALRSLFDDDDEGNRGCDSDDLDGVEGLEDDDETSVIDLIRSRREGEGREFKIDDEIDRAADMFITRVRRRMGAQQPELGGSGFH